ncbi:MAG: metal ABC transporter permease [Chloroflexota bacterium]
MEIIEFITSIFTSYTLRNVALGAAIMGSVSGALGAFAMLRKQSLMGDAMSHAALPGIAIIFILTQLKTTLALFLGAFVSAWLGALLVMVVVRYTRIKADSGLGLVLAVFFGFGLALLSWIQRNMGANQAGLDKYLFGRAATLIQEDVITVAIFGAVAIIMVIIFWKEFKLLCFDPDFAATQGFPVRFLDVLLTSLIVLAIVLGLQMVGVVLMAALIVAPAAAARQWTDNMGKMVILSALIGGLSGSLGAIISATARGLSTGPVIVLTASAFAVFSLLLAPNRGLVWEWIRRRRNNRRLAAVRVLEVLHDLSENHTNPEHPHPTATLQATLPSYTVPATLQRLESEGLVVQPTAGHWAITQAGVQRTHQLFNDEQTSPSPFQSQEVHA